MSTGRNRTCVDDDTKDYEYAHNITFLPHKEKNAREWGGGHEQKQDLCTL
jgi:hypothetical protein